MTFVIPRRWVWTSAGSRPLSLPHSPRMDAIPRLAASVVTVPVGIIGVPSRKSATTPGLQHRAMASPVRSSSGFPVMR
jgi:hypothetical protein